MTETDPFAAPTSGRFPSLDDLEGNLLLIVPDKIETVRNQFDKDGSNPTRERARGDVTVFGDDGSEETYEDMFLSQAVLLEACRKALKPGRKPMILGRLVKVATKDTRDKLKIEDTPEAFAEARKAWLKKGGKGAEPKHVWLLHPFSEEDAAKARAYLARNDQFAADAAN